MSKDSPIARNRTPFTRSTPAPLLAGLGLLVVALAAATTWNVARTNRSEAEAAFAITADQVANEIVRRMRVYEHGLRGTRGAIIAAGDSISHDRFLAYSQSRDYADEFPGIRGFGFIQRVPVSGEEAFLSEVRADGESGFAIRQLQAHAGDRFVIRHIEPAATNQGSRGLDIASEIHRREAAVESATSGEVRMSHPVTLVQDQARIRQGMLILLPVYREGMPLDSAEKRWAATRGWAFAPLSIEQVLGNLHDQSQMYSLSLRDRAEPAPAAPFVQSGDFDSLGDIASVDQDLQFYGRDWLLSIRPRPALAAHLNQLQPWVAGLVVLVVGGLSVALLGLSLAAAARRRASAWQQARIAALVEDSTEAIIACDSNGSVTHWNHAAEAVLGRTADEAIGCSFLDILAARCPEEAARLGSLQDLADTRLKLRTGDRYTELAAIVAPIRNTRGTQVGTSVILHDVSESARAEERFRLVVEAMPNAILMVDPAGTIAMANARAEELFDYSRAEMLGRSLDMLLPEQTRGQHDSHILHYFSNPVARPMGAGRDLYGRRRDGSLAPLEIGLNPIETSTGRYTLASIIDITERKRHEAYVAQLNAALEQQVLDRTAELRTYSARLQAILDHASLAIIATDAEGTITLFNPEAERMLGYAAAELIGRNSIDLLHLPDELVDRWTGIEAGPGRGDFSGIASRMTSDHPAIGEWTYVRKDCSLVPVRLGISTLRDESGATTGFLVLASDLTEQRHKDSLLRQAIEEAERSNRYKSDFLANMSHEIRTPMNAIMGMTYLLERAGLPDTAQDMVRKINGSARSLLEIINEVLDFSRIEAGKIELEDAPFDLDEVLDNVAALTAPALGNKPVEMVVSPAPPTARYLRGDALRLGQVLVNLVGNAIKFTERGEVVVSVWPLASAEEGRTCLAFAVSDTGIGIPEEKMRHIFSPFTQVDSSTTRRYGGSGLGLSICRRLVELMGGELRVDSTPGKGSRFHFEVSLANDEAPASTPDHQLPYRVLIVDDHEVARANLSLIVRGFGWEATTAASGADAVRAMAGPGGHGYDIVLMDWRMPDMDGIRAATTIRAGIEEGQQPIVIMVTAVERQIVEKDGQVDAIDAILTKPVTASTLYNTIVSALERRNHGRPVQAGAMEASQRLDGITLLVVDDSDINREVAQRILEDQGAVVDLAADGRQAIERLAAEPDRYDAILMDVQMPEMDGYEATRRIRATPGTAGLPVIALTAGALTRQQDAALACGMDAFVTKPFEVRELVDVICQLVPTRNYLPHPPAPARPRGAEVRSEATGGPVPLLDLSRGLRQWGQEAPYRRYLGRFAGEYAGIADEVAALARSGQREQAAAQLHRMRGAAGSLALPRLADAGKQVEAILETGQDIEPALADFGCVVDDSIDAIRRYLGDDAGREAAPVPSPHLSTADPTDVLERLLEALDSDEPLRVEPLLHELEPMVAAAWFEQLLSRIDAFDFRAAEAWVRAHASGPVSPSP